MALNDSVFALILAAGQSKRMHQSKIILPWGNTTIIEHIISLFRKSGISDVFVVTGGYREAVELEVAKAGGRSIFNANYANDELTISLQVGMGSISLNNYSAGFISLGDQPNIHQEDIKKLLEIHRLVPEKIVIPSFNFRRGHPWLVPSRYFDELAKLAPPETLRTFLNKHNDDIEYVVVNDDDIITDLDTPEDYERLKPK